ncbi:carnosine N-methyltransferase [Ischnura elegans]|uniref:carnosine N-methyltransferase n=1 Tax=Ischnura elegans TaxID=197161 RepID=UPI001ED869EB|nr:carnosine N-methyltransferase [Ischnura elegans]
MDSTQDEKEEREHFLRIVRAFKHYKAHSLDRIARTERFLAKLPHRHRGLLARYSEHLANLKTCVENNDKIIKKITKDVSTIFENSHLVDSKLAVSSPSAQPSPADMEKVQATLKQFVRDWSEEGKLERQACYQPIIDELEKYYPESVRSKQEHRVLVPGAGLGRLAYEIASRGFMCQGNEFSLFMLFGSNFILNRCEGPNTLQVHPWVHQSVNCLNSADQTRGVRFPDVNPSCLPPHAHFSMAAGDFLEIYTENDYWDCVATCFFIDCANNIVAFIETIYKIIKPGGIWINLGPLLYHFADMLGEESIEPSYELVKEVILGIGFIIEKEETGVKTTYAQNPYSLLKYEYDSVFLVCRKPEQSFSYTNGTQEEVEDSDFEESQPA